MTPEEKNLLLKDLCARLPYGVKLGFYASATKQTYICTLLGLEPQEDEPVIAKTENGSFYMLAGHVKPYLFPLSSMTDEQCEELNNLIHEHFILDDGFNEGISFKTYGDILVWLDEKPINECYFIFDYFNKNHLDYRDLISMSLALDATGINIY